MHNAAEHLPACLGELLPLRGQGMECLVVDDGSTDDSVAVAQGLGFRVLSTGGQLGPGAARNLAARQAGGDILLFLDADVRAHSDVIQRVRQAFAMDSSLGAVSGSYDDAPAHPSWISQWRNLLHCYTHQNASLDATTFWAGCGAIRRELFLRFGGFDERFRFLQDVELGARLYRAGVKLRFDPRIQVQHRKRWTLGTMLRTDLLGRAIPWTRIILRERRMPDDLNLKRSQRISVLLALLSLLLVGAGCFRPALFVPAILCLLGLVLLNLGFYRFLAARRGWRFVVATFPLHLLYYCNAALGFGCGLAMSIPGGNPSRRVRG